MPDEAQSPKILGPFKLLIKTKSFEHIPKGLHY